MGQILSRGVAVGLVIGLLAGFLGGFFSRQLGVFNAATDTGLSTTGTSTLPIYSFTPLDGDQSGNTGNYIMSGIGDGLEKYITELGSGDAVKGINLLSSGGTTSMFTLPGDVTKTILGLAASRVLAADGDVCSNIQWDWAKSGLKSAYENFYKQQQDYCTTNIDLSGTISIEIYKTGTDGLGRQIVFTFTGTQDRFYWTKASPTKCKTNIESKRVIKSGIANYQGGKWSFVSDRDPSATLICKAVSEVTLSYSNPNQNSSKCCGTIPGPIFPIHPSPGLSVMDK